MTIKVIKNQQKWDPTTDLYWVYMGSVTILHTLLPIVKRQRILMI